ncbi:MAG: RNA polymerase sigma factor [Tepidisphaerales bacterium]
MLVDPVAVDVSLARQGDRAALERLLVLFFASVRATVQAVLPARLRGELSEDDLAQEACIEAIRSISTLASDDPRAFRAWLLRIARRRAINQVRLRLTRKRGGEHVHHPLAAHASHGDLVSGLLPLLTRSTRSPRSAMAHAEMLQQLRTAVNSLESQQRELLKLRFTDQLPYDEIARKLNKSPEAARMMAFRTLRMLRSLLLPP